MNSLSIYLALFWFVCGAVILLMSSGKGELLALWRVNPVCIYRHFTQLNVFGAICVSIFFSLLCPPATVCYWFCKLCTVGRRTW